jgi:2-polyprenyl-6-methoxyphenol hydroxylase-like FAD-dependent oxidoreductase
MSQPRALIIGGSVGGLFAAHLLRSIGWDVLVFERSTGDLATRGTGIGTQDALHEVMQRIGLRDDETMAVGVSACQCIDRDGRILGEMPLTRVTSAWTRFYRPLREALPDALYRAGHRLEGVEQTAQSVTAIFANGERISGDLLVGADGVASTVRAQMLPDVRTEYAGYIGWRALVAEAELPAAFRDAFFDRYTFCLPDRELVVAYPVPAPNGDTRPGHRAYNVVWYRLADAAEFAKLCTDSTGRRYDGAIPPPLIRPEIVADMKASGHALLAPQIADILDRTERPFFQPIYDLSAPRMAFGRVVLLGDAAFIARPHGGAGVTKAALDAAGLADALLAAGGDIKAALPRYDEQQRRYGRYIVARGRHLGGYVGGARERIPAAMMPDYHATNAGLHELATAPPAD